MKFVAPVFGILILVTFAVSSCRESNQGGSSHHNDDLSPQRPSSDGDGEGSEYPDSTGRTRGPGQRSDGMDQVDWAEVFGSVFTAGEQGPFAPRQTTADLGRCEARLRGYGEIGILSHDGVIAPDDFLRNARHPIRNTYSIGSGRFFNGDSLVARSRVVPLGFLGNINGESIHLDLYFDKSFIDYNLQHGIRSEFYFYDPDELAEEIRLQASRGNSFLRAGNQSVDTSNPGSLCDSYARHAYRRFSSPKPITAYRDTFLPDADELMQIGKAIGFNRLTKGSTILRCDYDLNCVNCRTGQSRQSGLIGSKSSSYTQVTIVDELGLNNTHWLGRYTGFVNGLRQGVNGHYYTHVAVYDPFKSNPGEPDVLEWQVAADAQRTIVKVGSGTLSFRSFSAIAGNITSFRYKLMDMQVPQTKKEKAWAAACTGPAEIISDTLTVSPRLNGCRYSYQMTAHSGTIDEYRYFIDQSITSSLSPWKTAGSFDAFYGKKDTGEIRLMLGSFSVGQVVTLLLPPFHLGEGLYFRPNNSQHWYEAPSSRTVCDPTYKVCQSAYDGTGMLHILFEDCSFATTVMGCTQLTNIGGF